MEVDLILNSDPSPQAKRMESLNNQIASAKDEKKASQIKKQLDRLEEQILKRSKKLVLGRSRGLESSTWTSKFLLAKLLF